MVDIYDVNSITELTEVQDDDDGEGEEEEEDIIFFTFRTR